MKILKDLLKDPIFYAFLIPVLYWGYLLLTSQMVIRHDSLEYVDLGKMIYKQGWMEFFQTGPHREPLYPLLISAAMLVGDFLSLPYLKILTLFQILLLALTQILILRVLDQLKVRKGSRALAVLYLGVSPALVNSALSLYSEILMYPLVLGIILAGANAGHAIYRQQVARAFGFTLLYTAMFVLAVLNKAIFEYLFYIMLIPPLVWGIAATVKKQKQTAFHAFLSITVAAGILTCSLHAYKVTNLHHNDHYEITGRGGWMLYGSAAKRTEPMTPRRLLAGLASVPGDNVCRSLFGDECLFWSFQTSDHFGMEKLKELRIQEQDSASIDRQMKEAALNQALDKPVQYLLLTVMEATKALFWESTKIGFVEYPAWLAQLFDFTLFKNGLRLGMAILTFFSVFYYFSRGFYRRGRGDTKQQILQFLMAVMIIGFIGLYSLVTILTRYILPIASLFLIIIAVVLEDCYN